MGYRWLLCVSVVAFSTSAAADLDKPKFAQDDCVQRIDDVERWEDPSPILKILEVGRKKYRISRWLPYKAKFSSVWESSPFLIIDMFNSKVRCPK